ncbi:MAG: 30S ribosomal protein S2 [Nitrospira sp.]|nr:30S ribosomal protein S2 [Nitrospira sp.]
MQKDIAKLQKYLSGIKNMRSLPGAVFVLDTRVEKIAVQEAKRLDIPVIAIQTATATRTTSPTRFREMTTPFVRSN